MKRNAKREMVLAALAAALLLIPQGAFSQQKIDEKRDVNGDCDISIDNLSGSVSVTTWDRNEVHITGTLGEGAERLSIEGDRKALDVKVVIPDGAKNVEETILEVKVPEQSALSVSTVSADITVDGPQGELDLNSVSGNITAEGKPKRAALNAVSGDVSAELETDDLTVNTVSGEIGLRRAEGDIHAETVSGDVEIDGGLVEKLRVNAFSGDIVVEASPAKGASFVCDAHSGDVTLRLPGDLDARVEVSSFSGDIENDFDADAQSKSKYGPGSELEFTRGSGSASIKINTFSGDARLERQ
jgi:hypothetical protein